jgi:hypothetical protein
MSNLIPANISVPAHLAQYVGKPSALAQSLSGGLASGGGEGFPRIGIKGGRFRIHEGDTETVLDSTTIDVVIVASNPRLSKTWYAKAWDKDSEPSAPDCFSLDGVSPDPQSTNPQNDLCASCPQNAWGSKVTPTGQQIKACADKKRLAVVSADDAAGPVYLLEVTPAALKGLNQYQKELVMRGIAPEIVTTKVSFDTDASFPKLKFGFGGFNTPEIQEAVNPLFGSDDVRQITGEVNRQPVAVPQITASVQVAPKPVMKVVEPEPAPAPVAEPESATPKRGFGATKQAVKPAVKATVAAAPVASATSLADSIAALVGEVNADDA